MHGVGYKRMANRPAGRDLSIAGIALAGFVPAGNAQAENLGKDGVTGKPMRTVLRDGCDVG